MNTNKESELVEVFAGTNWQVGLVQSLLEDEEITAFLKDETMGNLYPWYTASGGVGSVKLLVSNLDYEKAKIIVHVYEENEKLNI